ncbi:MAG: HAD family hydrolase [Gemmatimonadota bacterium]|nr:MAG: HAD family hydrolase [Gemmatimonadota bacterium]
MNRDADGRRAVFIDRDGTLIEERGDLGDPGGVELLPGVARAVRRLQDAGLLTVLVTNQSGIAKGLFSFEDFEAVQERLIELLAEEGVRLHKVYMCPHHPDVTGPCDCRKPGPGMYRRAAAELSVDLARSFYVGDRWRDVAVTEEVGGRFFLVRTGAAGQGAPPESDHVADLSDAVDHILAILEEEEVRSV